tara:strand:+ start:109 stop:297 length:189 start_codon:yes stop_codon:yes gene_type:complete
VEPKILHVGVRMTYNEFKKKYLPKQYEKELLERIQQNPKEYGKYLAHQLLEKLRNELKGSPL